MRIEQIYKTYKGKLKGYINKYIANDTVADDVVEEVFYKFIVADREDSITAVASWLYQTAQHLIIDHARKKKEEAMPYISNGDDDNIADIAIAELLADPNNTPEMELLRNMLWEEFNLALEELPPEQRTVFELTEMQHVPYSDIAETTGIPINTLMSRKHYAVNFLRKRLATFYNDIFMD